jgi:polyribonucleotide nucleotidyltransferase
LAASAALAVSDIPIKEIISEVRIARINGAFVINPTRTQLETADMDFLIAATEKNLMMVEGESKECAEADLVKALELAHEAIKIQIKAQHELRKQVGITSKRDYKKPESDQELNEKVIAFAKQKVYDIARKGSSKNDRTLAFSQVKDELLLHLGTEITDVQKKLTKKYYEDLKWEVVRNMMLDDRIRLDGRQLDQVRGLAMPRMDNGSWAQRDRHLGKHCQRVLKGKPCFEWIDFQERQNARLDSRDRTTLAVRCMARSTLATQNRHHLRH